MSLDDSAETPNPRAADIPTSLVKLPALESTAKKSFEDLNRELAGGVGHVSSSEPTSTEFSAEADSQAPQRRGQKIQTRQPQALHLATSTFLSLVMVLGLLLLVRWMVPGMVEKIRYSWHRGQLRAQYDHSSDPLSQVSLSSIEAASERVSGRVGPTVVHINMVHSRDKASRALKMLYDADPSSLLQAQGSGFVINKDGYVLTNSHVVDTDGKIEVTFSDGQKCDATIVGRDKQTDVAVLKVDASDLMVAPWGDSDAVVVGTPVWAVGSPFGLQHTVSFGIISGKHRVDFSSAREVSGTPGSTAYGDMMQSDVVLHPGNSGGPLVNAQGEVVGMNAAILGEAYQGISFAIPSKVARRVAGEIIQSGEVQRPWLGVSLKDLAATDRYDADGKPLRGVRVMGFPRVSPARVAGLEVGDVIVKFAGQDVFGRSSLQQMIAAATVGDTVRVEVLRNREPASIKVVLAKRNPNTY